MISLRKFHWFYYVSLVAVFGLLVAGASYCQDSKLSKRRRAWEVRQVLLIETQKDYPYGYSPEQVATMRWNNYRKEEYPNVSELVKVYVNRASDTNDIVIHLTDVDGRTVTLWTHSGELKKSIDITTITPY